MLSFISPMAEMEHIFHHLNPEQFQYFCLNMAEVPPMHKHMASTWHQYSVEHYGFHPFHFQGDPLWYSIHS